MTPISGIVLLSIFSFSFLDEYPNVAIEPAHIVAPTAGESKASAMCIVIFPYSVTFYTLVARFVFLSSFFAAKMKIREKYYYITQRSNRRPDRFLNNDGYREYI
jgi:uncharacterized membrane protein